jgi:hypothetical protein
MEFWCIVVVGKVILGQFQKQIGVLFTPKVNSLQVGIYAGLIDSDDLGFAKTPVD